MNLPRCLAILLTAPCLPAFAIMLLKSIDVLVFASG
jgi:hypothetical protein